MTTKLISKEWYYHKSIKIPSDWNVKPFEKILAKLDNGFSYKEDEEINSKNGLPITRIETIAHGSIDLKKVGYVEKHSEKRCKTMLEEDILFSHINSLKHVGKTAIYEKTPPILIHGMNLLRIIPNDEVYAKYLFHFLRFKTTRNRIRSLSQQAVNQVSVNTADLKKFLKIILPPKPEQKKIASILSNLDTLIRIQEEYVNDIQNLKKEVMKKLFTKGIRHEEKDFVKVKSNFGKFIKMPNSWRISTIGKEFKFSSGSTPTRQNPKFFQGNIAWVTSSDLNRKIITETLEKITLDAVTEARLKIYPKGTFVIAIYGLEAIGTRGRCGILGIDATLNQACLAFHKSDTVYTEFIYQYFLLNGDSIALQLAQGTKQQNLSGDILNFAKIAVPPVPEQEEIARILSNFDKLIEYEIQNHNEILQIKEGLMQQLLTGQIKVVI